MFIKVKNIIVSDIMKCEYCKSNIEKIWNFCPSCSHSIDKFNTLSDFLNRHVDQLKKMFNKYEEPSAEKPHGITISISSGLDSPKISFFPEQNKEIEHYKINNREKNTGKKLLKKAVEPHSIINKKNNLISFQINLPGIKSESDIELEMLPNSVELRANGDHYSYFKILNINKNYYLSERKFKDEKLFLVFTS